MADEQKRMRTDLDDIPRRNIKQRENEILSVAAAPDILTALRRLTHHAESAILYLETVDNEDDQAAINKFIASISLAKEAIAKAEGR